MTTFVIGNVGHVPDPAAMAEYRAKVLATLRRYGGGFAVRGGKIDVLEGDWRPTHLSVMEFPTEEDARRWYTSPEYREIHALRDGVAMDLVIVSGDGE